MRSIILLCVLLPVALHAQDAARFARAMERGPTAVDRWMERAFAANKHGDIIDNGSTTYTVHYYTFDTLVDFLRQQPGVIGSAWDKCMVKLAYWPGHSCVGVRYVSQGVEHERCYSLQEGIQGTVNVFGWRAPLRKSKEQLKFLGARDCPGFVEAELRRCDPEGH